jgi:hypothetical protein
MSIVNALMTQSLCRCSAPSLPHRALTLVICRSKRRSLKRQRWRSRVPWRQPTCPRTWPGKSFRNAVSINKGLQILVYPALLARVFCASSRGSVRFLCQDMALLTTKLNAFINARAELLCTRALQRGARGRNLSNALLSMDSTSFLNVATKHPCSHLYTRLRDSRQPAAFTENTRAKQAQIQHNGQSSDGRRGAE